MDDLPSDGGAKPATIDLRRFYRVFFEEASENLEAMERLLLELDVETADHEALNAIFRCAHSIKGGAATFGFTDLAELTHQIETLLGKLRRRELRPTLAMVDVLLAAGDALKAQLARHSGAGGDEVDTSSLLCQIGEMVEGGSTQALPTPTPKPQPAATRALELTVGPLSNPAQADTLAKRFQEFAELGTIEPLNAECDAGGLRRFKIVTSSSDQELLELFTFHVARAQLALAPLDPGFGFFDGAPGAPSIALPEPKAEPKVAAGSPESTTLRVSVEKVDQLINLVGELVITQAMLARSSARIDSGLYQQLASGLSDLERNTRDLQQAVMSIRMIPMSIVFNRFPRMLRDLAARLGKQVEMVTQGEATELDKGLVEKIIDPLTHLVRNSCDHGIEPKHERLAKGKPETGSITLIASHQGGNIVIEVRDDGRGMNRDKLLRTARERGIDAPDSMTDAEVWNLVFMPGFSTVDEVTEVSGRGVGMDVVKQNIASLGGSVEIDSAEGYGMSVRVRLPLTLAIMDGMSVGVGDECYIVPLSSVIESLQVEPGMIRTIGGASRVVEVRGGYMPVLDLDEVFDVPRFDFDHRSDIMVVVEADGSRVALLVDELLGQQQVVVKNLEANYRRVNDVSAATILGDGRVALILDIGSLVRRSRH
jgi:two-component system chemotaxis sensor kinase CheA